MSALNGKAVVVTGAGRGIGRAYAMLAAAEGAAVVVNDIDADVAEQVAAEIRDAGGRAVAHPADVGLAVPGVGPVLPADSAETRQSQQPEGLDTRQIKTP